MLVSLPVETGKIGTEWEKTSQIFANTIKYQKVEQTRIENKSLLCCILVDTHSILRKLNTKRWDG